MYVYFILILIHIGLWVLAQRLKMNLRNKIILSVSFVIPLIVVCSFKNMDVGLDTQAYYYLFSQAREVPSGAIEVGFSIYNKILSFTHMPYTIYLLITYTITFIPIAFFAALKSDKPISYLFIFCYVGYFGFAISGLRQGLAIGIALSGFCLFKKDRYLSIIYPVITSTIAFSIHKSGFIFYIFIIFAYIKLNKLALYYIGFTIVFLSCLSTPLYSLLHETFSMSITYIPVVSTTYFSLAIYLFLMVLMLVMRANWFNKFDENILGKCDGFKPLKFFRNNEVNEAKEEVNYSNLLYIFFAVIILTFGVNTSVMARFIHSAAPFAFMALIQDTKYLRSKTSKTLFGLNLILFSVIYFVFASLIKDPLHIADYRFGFIV